MIGQLRRPLCRYQQFVRLTEYGQIVTPFLAADRQMHAQIEAPCRQDWCIRRSRRSRQSLLTANPGLIPQVENSDFVGLFGKWILPWSVPGKMTVVFVTYR